MKRYCLLCGRGLYKSDKGWWHLHEMNMRRSVRSQRLMLIVVSSALIVWSVASRTSWLLRIM